MSNVKEINVMQNERLFDLLLIKKANKELNIKGLSRSISRSKASMTKEEIAYVEKLVEQEDDI